MGKNKFLEFFGFGGEDEYDDEEEYFEEEAPRRAHREPEIEEKPVRMARKPKVVNVSDRRGSAGSSVIIYSPKTYNEAQPLATQLIQNKYVIIKLDKVDKSIGQRILDFMSGAAYACDAQISEVSKGSIYLFTSSRTMIDKTVDLGGEAENDGFVLEDDEF